MARLLGIDTGGTFTDAVLFDEGTDRPVAASAKALTTPQDLSLGIGAAIGAVLGSPQAGDGTVALVSLSTTLATNALVEGHGGSVALVFIGFDPGDAARAGLDRALAGDPLIAIAGGHGPGGDEAAPLDLSALAAGIAAAGAVDAYAVVSRFGSRNPAHEIAAREAIRGATGRPVTCGHELSARLNGPRRAVTSVLNARLVGLITELISATEAVLADHGIDAPLMLVRGDGALVSAAFAKDRPIETILSGPAASLVGASALTGIADGVVADIGGTTTDIGILSAGRPRLSPDGAEVGGFQTMVEAVDMRAVGLGGDSMVTVSEQGLGARVTLGPGRAVPLALLASEHPDLVHRTLEAQLRADRPGAEDARFARLTRRAAAGSAPTGEAEVEILAALADGPRPVPDLLTRRRSAAALSRLVAAGRVRLAAFTPSDAAHVLGLHDAWDGAAARLGAAVMARRRDGTGRAVAVDGAAFARAVIDALTRRSAETVLSAALAADGIDAPDPATNPILGAALDRRASVARLSAGLARPLIGLGASAPVYYPEVARLLGTDAAIPTEAGVANAVGAVAGRISVSRTVLVTAIEGGGFRIHDPATPAAAADCAEAEATARARAAEIAELDARRAGADTPVVTTSWEPRTALVEGREMFIEGLARATAEGRPRLAHARQA